LRRINRILEKDRVTEEDYIYFCLEACASSCRFGKIRLTELGGKKYELRGNLNVLLSMPLGAGKTTSVISIPNSVYTNRVTFASLVGTINKDGEWVEGELIRSAGKVLILDEFSYIPTDVKEVLNQVLEQHPFSRSVGLKIREKRRKTSKYLKYLVDKNKIFLDVRLSCIACSTKVRRDHGVVSRAWLTRFLPIYFFPPPEYYERLTIGDTYFKVNPKRLYDGDFSFREYPKAHEYFWSGIKKKPYYKYFKVRYSEFGYLARLLGDMIRLSAFLTALDGRKVIKFNDFKLIFDKFSDIVVWNFISTGLTEVELMILHNPNLGNGELANLVGVSEKTVQRRRNKLKELFLIGR